MPKIQESAEELKRLMKAERHPQKRQRLLFLVASNQATTWTTLVPLFGGNRETVGNWLDCYSRGGCKALLIIRTPLGKSAILPELIIAELRAWLRRSNRVGSYQDVQVQLMEERGITIKCKTLANFLHTKFRHTSKVLRHRRIQKTNGNYMFLRRSSFTAKELLCEPNTGTRYLY